MFFYLFPSSRSAFSLVELSIVLVILGLLVGGILSGKSLIHSAELRSITSDYQQYVTAIHSFRDKYFQLPGDMNNATAIWGKDNANCPADSGAAAANGTCNGNGDGTIRFGTVASGTGEAFQAWKQLGLAGMIPGNYTGIAGATLSTIGDAADHSYGTNSPKSRITNAGWGITHFDNSATVTTIWTSRNHLNWLTIGGNDHMYADDPFLTPEDAWNLDTKMDDGKPATGNIESLITWALVVCADLPTSSGTYQLSQTGQNCSLIFKY